MQGFRGLLEPIRKMSLENRSVFLAKVMPYLCLFAVVLFFIVYGSVGQYELALKGLLTYGIPVILASGIAIWRTRSLKVGSVTTQWHFILTPRLFSHLTAIFAILYLISLCLLVIGEARPLAYFFLIAVMTGLIFIEILGVEKEHNRRKVVILTQVVLLYLNIIFGQLLKFPLYYGGTDLLTHMRYISLIVDSGQITPTLSFYQYFPLFHIFNAVGMLITGMEIKMSYFILNGLAFATVIPIVYLLIGQLTKDARLPLVAVLCYSVSQPIIASGLYMVTRSMAYVLAMLSLYMLIRQGSRLPFRVMVLSLIPALILTHTTTLIHFSLLLAVIVIIGFILYGRSRYISHIYLLLFTIGFLGYWMFFVSPFFEGIVKLALATAEVSPVVSLIQGVPVPLLMSVAQNTNYIILLFLAVLGSLAQLYETGNKADLGYIWALFSLAAIPFFVPYLYIMFSQMFLLYRFEIFLVPFFVFVMAKGLLWLVDQLSANRHHWKQIGMAGVSLFFIIIFSFSSLTISGNWTDLNIGKVIGMQNRDYFINAELESFSFMSNHEGGLPIYSDYPSAGYLYRYADISGATMWFNVESMQGYYFLFRKQEFHSRGQLEYGLTSPEGEQLQMYLYRHGDTPDLQAMLMKGQKIYDNQSVEIYLVE